MRKIIITITAICSLSFASYYDVGDIVSDTHQNITKATCFAGNEYDVGDNWKPVSEGMVFTIEPGIYIREENFGCRLENNYLIGIDENIDLMATIPVEAEEIEEIMNSD